MNCIYKDWSISLKVFLVLLVSISSVGVYSQNSLLWKVTGKKKKNTSYLYGTFHTSDERAFFLMDTLEHYIGECDVFAGEVNMDDMNENPASLMKYVIMQDSTLQDLYSKDEFEIVRDSLMKKMGAGAMMMMKIKPFFILPMLALSEGEGLIELEGGVIIDDYLQTRAKEKGLEIHALETMDEAVGAIDAIPLSEQADMLLDALISKGSDMGMEDLVEKYIQQDLEGMMLLFQEEEMKASVEKSLLENRNNYFSERLMKIMKKESVFCAVGALHLPGKTGLINSLREKGYTVEAIIVRDNVNQ